MSKFIQPENIKKTAQETLNTLVSASVHTLVTEDQWTSIILTMTAKTASTTSSTPREITILKDVDQNIIGRQCTLSKKWFPIAEFFKGTSVIKVLDQEKAKIYNAAKKLEKEAEAIRDEAKTAETPEERLAVYDRYEEAIDTAKAARTAPVEQTLIDEASAEGLADIEALADSLGVVLGETANVAKPKEEDKAEDKA